MITRLATADDAVEVVRLACVMFESMGMPPTDDVWRAMAVERFTARLPIDAAAVVVDHPDARGRLVASGVGTISTRLPTPTNPSGATGYVQWVATDDEFRGRGYARAVMSGLLDWFEARDVPAVELHSTKMGEHLYRSLGFSEGTGPIALRRRAWELASGRE
jgi:GNAT superfamily N-acetyltransferase